MIQQTAVDWYAKEHRKLLIQLESKELSLGEYAVKHHDILKQANQMFEEQIKKAALALSPYRFSSEAEQYYNETYKQQ